MQRNRTENWKDVLSVDFSAESKMKEETEQALLRHICQRNALNLNTEKENFTVKQTTKRHFKRTTAVALAACLVVVLSISALAVANYFNLGQYAQYIFGTDTSDNEVVSSDEALTGDMTTGDSRALDSMSTLFDSLDDAQSYLAFNALTFTYVPEDYVLEGYRVYNDADGQPRQDTEYLQMNFYNSDGSGDTIFVQARLMDEETAFTYESDESDSKIEQTTINGHEAILKENSVSILMDDVIYMISAKNLPQSEVIKMAESLGA